MGLKHKTFNTSNLGTFEIRYSYTKGNENCTSTFTFPVTVIPRPSTKSLNITLCHENGSMAVDLRDYNTQINNDPAMVFEYYSESTLTIPIPDPANFIAHPGSQAFIKVIDINGCHRGTVINFSFETLNVEDKTLEICDVSDDYSLQAYNVNLSDFNDQVYTHEPGLTYKWFSDITLEEEFEVTTIDTIKNLDSYYFVVYYSGCRFPAEVIFSVLPQPEIIFDDLLVCDYDSTLLLSPLASPPDGTFSGDWIVDGTFNIQDAGPGNHPVTYTYEGDNGCIAQRESIIHVFHPEDLFCPDDITLCLNAGLTELTGASPQGGIYTGTGITQSEGRFYFNPLVAGADVHTITYTSSQHGCTHSCTFKIIVTELPSLTCPDDMILCEGTDDLVLNQFIQNPAGGEFSGTNISFINGNYIFHASSAAIGSYTIQYQFTDTGNSCQNSCSFTIRIIKRPEIEWKNDLSFCSNIGLVELELAIPIGGTYSGDYITNETWMDFSLTPAGLHAVSYIFTDLNGCSTISTRTLQVHESPVANAGSDQFLTDCGTVQLNGSAVQGTLPYSYSWSPSPLLNNPLIPNPESLPLGSITNFRFMVTDSNGCKDTDHVSVGVENGIAIQKPGFGPICINNPPLTLEGGNPVGGQYYINEDSFASDEFDPAMAGVGDHFLYYILADENGCYATAESIITVNQLPSLNWDGEAFCAFSGLQEISLARPMGGDYSGYYISGNHFNTTLSGAGNFPVTYTFIDSWGCQSSKTANVTVNALPKVTAGNDQTILLGNYTTLTTVETEPGDYSYKWEPPVFLVSPHQQTTFTRELLYSQVFKLQTTDKETSCVTKDEMVVYIEGGNPGFVYLTAKPAVICAGDSTRLETLVSGGKPPYKHYWYDEDPRLNMGAITVNTDFNNRIFTFAPVSTNDYYLKVTDSDGNDIFRSIRITVNQLPDVNFNFPGPFCHNTIINIRDFAPREGGNFFVNIDDQYIQPPFDTYPLINTAALGAGFHSFQYRFTDHLGCTNTATSTMEVVRVYPVGFTMDSYTGCSSVEVTFSPVTPGINNLSYSWNSDNVEFSQVANPSMNFTNDSDESRVYNIQLTVTDDTSGCTGSATSSLLVFPEPKAVINTQPEPSAPDTLFGCSAPFTVHFSSGASLNAQQFLWDFGDGATGSSEPDVLHTFKHAGTYNITLLAGTPGICQDMATFTIVIADGPFTSFSTDVRSGCSPLDISIQYDFIPDDDTQYYWDFSGDGNFTTYASGELPIRQELGNSEDVPQTIPITLQAISPQGCITQSTENIMVFPKVEAVIQVSHNGDLLHEDPEGCSPMHLGFSAGQSVNTNSYIWSFGDETGSLLEETTHTFFNHSEKEVEEYTVILHAESGYGCIATDTVKVKVNKEIFAYFETDSSPGCSSDTIRFENLSNGAHSYYWDFGDGNESNSENPVHKYDLGESNQPRSFLVTLEASNAVCTEKFSKNITVYPSLHALFEVSETMGCGTLDVDITNTGTQPAAGLTYEWNYGDGQQSFTTETMHSHTFINTSSDTDTKFTMSLAVSFMGMCVDIYEKDITVSAKPKALFTLEESRGCSPFEISIQNLSSGAETFSWNFGNTETSSESNPLHVFYNTSSEPQEFIVTLEAIGNNNCISRMERNITVLPQPTIEFTTESNTGCHPFLPVMENNSTGASRFQWIFGDGNTSDKRNPEHVFLNPSGSIVKKQPVQLRGWSEYGCETLFTDTITINPSPTAEIISSQQSGCAPFNPEIENKSSFAQQYSWNLGEGITSTDAQPEVIFQNTSQEPLISQISLEAINGFGCSSLATKTFTIYPQVQAEYRTLDGLMEGCSPLTISFQNASAGGNSFTWDFGNGSNSSGINPTRVFINESAEPKVFSVTLQATSGFGCIDLASRDVMVLPAAVADFSLEPATQTYPNTTITINNPFPDQVATFNWEFGDGTTSGTNSSQFTHTYPINENDLSTKEYWVMLNVSNDYCEAVNQQKAVILSTTPKADFAGDLKGCAPFEASFQNQSQLAQTFTWHFGDGSISFEENPTYIYTEPGKYELLLIASGDGGKDTIREIVEVLTTPKADFLIESRLLTASVNELRITNTSKSASYYLWEFGDGGTSVEFEPAYTFELSGLYDISLTVLTDSEPQCVDTKLMEKAIRVEDACMIAFPNAFIPNTAGPSDGSYIPAGNTNQVFYPVHNGLETYQLEIFNRWGEMIYRSNDPLIGWDGYIRGKLSELGVYVWKVTATCKNGNVINTAGDVTLVR
jgi:PKD repeat protein